MPYARGMPNVLYLPVAMAAAALGCLAYDLARPALGARPRLGATPLRILRPQRTERPAPPERSVAELATRIQELEAVVRRLRDAGHAVVAQRDSARAEAASLRLALGTTQKEVSELRQRLELQSLAVAASVPAAGGGGDAARFRAAKLAFARMFHPDNARGAEQERQLRTKVFKEFWAELERIEGR